MQRVRSTRRLPNDVRKDVRCTFTRNESPTSQRYEESCHQPQAQKSYVKRSYVKRSLKLGCLGSGHRARLPLPLQLPLQSRQLSPVVGSTLGPRHGLRLDVMSSFADAAALIGCYLTTEVARFSLELSGAVGGSFGVGVPAECMGCGDVKGVLCSARDLVVAVRCRWLLFNIRFVLHTLILLC